MGMTVIAGSFTLWVLPLEKLVMDICVISLHNIGWFGFSLPAAIGVTGQQQGLPTLGREQGEIASPRLPSQTPWQSPWMAPLDQQRILPTHLQPSLPAPMLWPAQPNPAGFAMQPQLNQGWTALGGEAAMQVSSMLPSRSFQDVVPVLYLSPVYQH